MDPLPGVYLFSPLPRVRLDAPQRYSCGVFARRRPSVDPIDRADRPRDQRGALEGRLGARGPRCRSECAKASGLLLAVARVSREVRLC